jgi:hypothetical protein
VRKKIEQEQKQKEKAAQKLSNEALMKKMEEVEKKFAKKVTPPLEVREEP